jgi:hypothetical protein
MDASFCPPTTVHDGLFVGVGVCVWCGVCVGVCVCVLSRFCFLLLLSERIVAQMPREHATQQQIFVQVFFLLISSSVVEGCRLRAEG